MVVLADVLLGMVWTDLTVAERDELFHTYVSDANHHRSVVQGVYDRRHASLLFDARLQIRW
jgi:hypothetical protein